MYFQATTTTAQLSQNGSSGRPRSFKTQTKQPAGHWEGGGGGGTCERGRLLEERQLPPPPPIFIFCQRDHLISPGAALHLRLARLDDGLSRTDSAGKTGGTIKALIRQEGISERASERRQGSWGWHLERSQEEFPTDIKARG